MSSALRFLELLRFSTFLLLTAGMEAIITWKESERVSLGALFLLHVNVGRNLFSILRNLINLLTFRLLLVM